MSYESSDGGKVILKSKGVAIDFPSYSRASEALISPPKVSEAMIAKNIEEYSFSWLKPIITSMCCDYDILKSEKNTLTEALASLNPPFNDNKGLVFPLLGEDIKLDQISSREFSEINNTLYESFKSDTIIRFAQFKKFCIEARVKTIEKTIDDLLSEASIAYKVENKYFETFDDIRQSSQVNRQLTAIQRGISWIKYSSEIRNIRTRSGHYIYITFTPLNTIITIPTISIFIVIKY